MSCENSLVLTVGGAGFELKMELLANPERVQIILSIPRTGIISQ